MSDDHVFPDSELGRLYRALDWEHSPLGPVHTWSPALKTATAMVLRQGLPQSVCWGPDLRQIYNDAFRVIMGDKHPAGMGQPVLHNWSEVADTVGPLFERVLAGETVTFQDLPLTVHRNGEDQAVAFTFSYSPVFDDAGTLVAIG